MLLFPLPFTICVPQSSPPLIGPLTAENGITRHFTLSALFPDMSENFLGIQNPHNQTVLTTSVLSIYTYPEPSDCHLKMLKHLTRSSLVPETGRNFSDSFFGFKQ